MAIYITKNAVNKLPDEFRSTYLPNDTRSLRSNHFRHIPFFISLANQSQGADFFQNGSENINVKVLQSAINAVSEKLDINQELKIDGFFGTKTETALKALQVALNVEETGFLDSNTLMALDSELSGDIVYDIVSGKIYNRDGSKTVIAINNSGINLQTFTEPSEGSSLGPEILNGASFNYTPPDTDDIQYGIIEVQRTRNIYLVD